VRPSIRLGAAVAFLASLSFTCARADWTGPTKWSQLPRLDQYGYAFSSETTVPSMVADDFLCQSLAPVVDVHCWGSYYEPFLWPYDNSDNWSDPTVPTGQDPGILAGFLIAFYSDVPGGVDPSMPWSHPGSKPMYEEFVPIADIHEELYATVTRVGGIVQNIWQYNVVLPEPFRQNPLFQPTDIDGDGIEDGTVYWIVIQAKQKDAAIQWGWVEAATLWHDNAVQSGFIHPEIPEYWALVANKDMAFELSIIPEPSLLLAGLLGLAFFLRLRRR
jgi:hypothetical protein